MTAPSTLWRGTPSIRAGCAGCGEHLDGMVQRGATTSADPKITALGDGTIAVMILDRANGVWRRAFTEGMGNGWQPWLQVGGVLLDVAAAGGGGQSYLAGQAPNGDLSWWQQTGNQWTWIGITEWLRVRSQLLLDEIL